MAVAIFRNLPECVVKFVKGREILKFRSLILIFVAKFDEDLYLSKIPQNVGANCEKGLKIRYSYHIKMRVKK